MLPTPNPDVIFRGFDHGGVLLSKSTEVYFGLNAVGARVWELLPPATETLEELSAAVALLFPEVDPATIDADVADLLDELATNQLVVTRG